MHDIPVHCLNPGTRDDIGKTLGTMLHMIDMEEEGGKGNYYGCGVGPSGYLKTP